MTYGVIKRMLFLATLTRAAILAPARRPEVNAFSGYYTTKAKSHLSSIHTEAAAIFVPLSPDPTERVVGGYTSVQKIWPGTSF